MGAQNVRPHSIARFAFLNRVGIGISSFEQLDHPPATRLVEPTTSGLLVLNHGACDVQMAHFVCRLRRAIGC